MLHVILLQGGRSHTEAADASFHWIAGQTHAKEVVEMLLSSGVYSGNTRAIHTDKDANVVKQIRAASHEFTERNRTVLQHFEHCHKLAADPLKTGKLILFGNAFDNHNGNKVFGLIELSNQDTATSTSTINITVADFSPQNKAALTKEKGERFRLVKNKHYEIIATAIIVKYVLTHTPKDTVVEIACHAPAAKDVHGAKAEHLIKLYRRSTAFYSKSGQPSVQKPTTRDDAFFLHLQAGVWACDEHWCRDNIVLVSAAPARNRRARVLLLQYARTPPPAYRTLLWLPTSTIVAHISWLPTSTIGAHISNFMSHPFSLNTGAKKSHRNGIIRCRVGNRTKRRGRNN
jgi:hypothetical protein